MGGQNHAPTKSIRLIAPSALLSQKLGEGFAAVLRSNNELENAIIVAMDHLHVEGLSSANKSALEYLDATLDLLELSAQKVSEIRETYSHLLDAAGAENYVGNPLASRVEEFQLGEEFDGSLILPAVNKHAWKSVEVRIKDMNILKTLEWEALEFEKLKEPTTELIEVIQRARSILERSGKNAFIEAAEHNGIPLRQRYARVFSMWNHLHAMFLYSALMMTELFYRSNDLPSLLSDGEDTKMSSLSVA